MRLGMSRAHTERAAPGTARPDAPGVATALGLGTVLTWASAFPAISFGLEHFSPGELSFARFLVASACFLFLIAAGFLRLPPLRLWPPVLLLGAIGIAAYQLLLGYGMVSVAAGAASMLIALSPAVTAVLASRRLGEGLSRRLLLSLGVALAGALLVTLGAGEHIRFEPRALLILGAVFATSVYFVWQKPLLAHMSSLSFSALSILAGTVVLLPFGLTLPGKLASAAPEQLFALVWLGVAPSFIGYVLWNLALARAPASRVALLLYVQPVISTFIAWAWLGQVPTVYALVGGAVLLTGVILGQGAPRRTT